MMGSRLGGNNRGSGRKAAVAAALTLAATVALAACGGSGDDRKGSLGAGSAGQIVENPNTLTPEEAGQLQDFYNPQRTAQAVSNPVDLPTLPKTAEVSQTPPEPAGKETSVAPAQPTDPVAPIGGKGGGSAQAPAAAGGQGFQVSPLTASADPFRLNGKLLITFKGGQQGSCSGTLVESDNQSLVVTAGHCIYDHQNGLGFASKMVFIPGFNAGQAPYGEWPVQFSASFSEWISGQNFNFDIAFLSLFRSPKNVPLQAQIGARGINFNYTVQPGAQFGLLGYPAAAPYDGNRLLACDSSNQGSIAAGPSGPPNMQAPCDFTPGSSGGGWMIGGQGGGAVGSVTSTRAPNGQFIDGPYFGNEALALYKQEQGKETQAGAPSPACKRLLAAQAALKKAKAKSKKSPSPAAKRAVAKAKKALKAAQKKAKNC